jgi:trehalose/maltose transport system substrate-binding protein
LIKQFNKQSKGFKVKQREMPIDTGQYFDKMRIQFQAGGGDIDSIIGDVIWPAQFAANGWVTDLSDRFKDTDEFLPGPMQAATYQDKVYAVPWYTDAGLLYYRKDLLEKSGYSAPPQTWDKLIQMAKKVSKDQGIKDGFVYQGAEYEGGVCNGLEYIRTYGGDVLDPKDPTKVIIDSPGSVAGMTTWADTIKSGASPKAVLQYKEDESAAFLNDEAVFIRNWPYMYALVAGSACQHASASPALSATLRPASAFGLRLPSLSGFCRSGATLPRTRFRPAPRRSPAQGNARKQLPEKRSQAQAWRSVLKC